MIGAACWDCNTNKIKNYTIIDLIEKQFKIKCNGKSLTKPKLSA